MKTRESEVKEEERKGRTPVVRNYVEKLKVFLINHFSFTFTVALICNFSPELSFDEIKNFHNFLI